ncbi:MAG TPA: SDR family oxidoreductase [Candidatus Acidoferrales bacterium]|jgi:3-oxoacyl-[acyl-carrier protein] reductase|nr:SDR family oxidoreductase [Candidatus Acidoferrales bacterium]
MSLRNRVAVVTGGTRGIGKGIALGLAQQGARIALVYRANKAAAQMALRELQAAGADCVAVETDITEPARGEQLIKTVADRYGRIDVLVNNVGEFRWGTLVESSVEEWTRIFDSNVLTVFHMCRCAVPLMRKGRWGRIINLGAVGAERAFGQAKISAYAAAKAAVVAMSRSLALEEAKNGITVNVVNPSSIDEKDLTLEEARKLKDARYPIGRPPTVDDVAAAVSFFASEEAEYVTGQVVNVSGGWML